MKKLAFLLAMCLIASMLPASAFAEEIDALPVDEMPGEAIGETGAMGLEAVPDAEEEPVWPEEADLTEAETDSPEDGDLPGPETEPADGDPEEEMDIAAPAAMGEEMPSGEDPEATREGEDADGAGVEGVSGEGEEFCVAAPHADPNGPQLAFSDITLGAGESRALQPTLPEGKPGALSCSSSDPSVAGVSLEGVVTALLPGEAVVTVAADDGTYAECYVHVRKAPDEVVFAAKKFVIGKGEKLPLGVVLGSAPGEFAGACSFSSSKKKIASVDDEGVVRGVKTGSATITVTTYNGLTARCKVSVKKAPKKIKASADKTRLGVGEAGQMSYVLPKGTAGRVTYESENPAVVSVDPNTGVIRGESVGEARVFAVAYNGKKGHVRISVGPAPKALDFPSAAITLGAGMKQKVSARIDDGATGEIKYAVENEGIATYKGGALKGVSPGTTVLTATTYNGLTAQCAVTVTPAPEKVSLPFKRLEIGVKQEFQLVPDVGECASTFTYTTSSKKIVKVSPEGVLKGVRKGSATVVIKTYNKKTFKLKVKVVSAPKKVSVSPESAELMVSEHLQLTANMSGGTASVIYSSDNQSVASVDPHTGEVIANAPGQAVISATTHNGKVGNCRVTVFSLPEWIEAETGFVQLAVGQSSQLGFTMSPGSRSPLSFSSQDPGIVEVSESGVVTGRSSGVAIVTAQTAVPGVSCQVSVTVLPAPDHVSLPADVQTLNVGDTMGLAPSIPEGTFTLFSYASSNPAVAKVSDDGSVVALAMGETTLTVQTSNGLKASMKLNVLDPWRPEKVTLLNVPDHMDVNETLQLDWKTEPEDAVADLVWSSANDSVAYVDQYGVIHAVGFGYVKISATSSRNSDIRLEFTLSVEGDSVVLAIPARTTDIAGIPGNLAMIKAIETAALNQIRMMKAGGVIGSSDASKREKIVKNAFKDYAFPWMTPALQKYWKAANSENGAKDFQPGRVYYGLPYISGSGKNRQYNAAKALSEKRYTDSGLGYYLLNQENLLNKKYCGNDCSCFVDAAIWGTGSSHSADRTAEIATSSAYKKLKNYGSLRTGDLICKGYAHVVLFLYYTNAEKTQIMIIENGGIEPGTNTVHCMIMDVSYYQKKGYTPLRLASLGA